MSLHVGACGMFQMYGSAYVRGMPGECLPTSTRVYESSDVFGDIPKGMCLSSVFGV